MLTTNLDDPTGYGRVIRSGDGGVTAIVEHRDATPDQLAVDEVNAGIYVFDGELLTAALNDISRDNAQGEYYLPDVLGIFAAAGRQIEASVAEAEEVAGVNSQTQLAQVDKEMRSRINEEWMNRGVWMPDPDQVFIEAGVELSPGPCL